MHVLRIPDPQGGIKRVQKLFVDSKTVITRLTSLNPLNSPLIVLLPRQMRLRCTPHVQYLLQVRGKTHLVARYRSISEGTIAGKGAHSNVQVVEKYHS
jgi:hypothetical protein